MPTDILMPAVAPSMTEGNLVRWAKRAGDPVKAGEVLFEVETDKAVVEVPAERDGVIAHIVVPEGTERVKVDTPVAVLLVDGEAPGAVPAAAAAGPSPGATATPVPATAAPTAPAVMTAPAASAAVAQAAVATPPAGRIFASPLARRIAQELRVDLARLRGSGPHGRILKADVEAAARSGSAPAPASAPPFPAGPAWEDLPHTHMRRVIAERLSEAKRSVPHFYLTIDCDVSALVAARRQANEHVPGLRLSVNDFVVRAAALALRKVPAVNAAWTPDAIRRYRDVDIAVAVSTPGGLITPIVRNADRKSLARISAEIRELAARAKENRLKPEEFQGGGFTISNLGMYGVREFSAIVNPPQSCILAVGAAEERPVARAGRLAVATLMTCTLSVDHRSVDGALGAEFLAAFKALVEAPYALVVGGDA